jgi:hypothetical protein
VLSDGLAKRQNCDRFVLIISDFEASFDSEASVNDDASAHELGDTEDCLSLCSGKIGEARFVRGQVTTKSTWKLMQSQ